MKQASDYDKETRRLEKKLRLELKDHERKVESVKLEIAELYKSKAKNEGQVKAKLKDKELAFIISAVLSKKVPTTKAVQLCASYFNKPEYWAKKVIRFKPLPEQVKRAFNYLDAHHDSRVKIFTKYSKLKYSEIMNKCELPGFLRRLKQLQIMAEELEANNLEIKQLNNQIVELKKNSASKDSLIKQIKQLTPKEHIIQIRNKYPEKSIAEVARIVGVSRNTVYKYSDN